MLYVPVKLTDSTDLWNALLATVKHQVQVVATLLARPRGVAIHQRESGRWRAYLQRRQHGRYCSPSL